MENGVVHSVTKETITKYKQLIAGPIMREVQEKAMCKELGRITQGYEVIDSTYHIEGTHTMKSLDLGGIKNIPRDRIITYARIIVDYRAQKKSPQQGTNNHSGELTQRYV